jgi:hypothetical protein
MQCVRRASVTEKHRPVLPERIRRMERRDNQCQTYGTLLELPWLWFLACFHAGKVPGGSGIALGVLNTKGSNTILNKLLDFLLQAVIDRIRGTDTHGYNEQWPGWRITGFLLCSWPQTVTLLTRRGVGLKISYGLERQRC